MRLFKNIFELKWGQAIVEIVLITVGILIAFQIDRWKEDSDRKEREIKTLKEIRESLHNDLKFLDNMADRYNSVISSLAMLQTHQFRGEQYHDSLQQHARMIISGFRFQQRTTAFDNLKIVGIDLITNDSIKTGLIDLYDFQYPRQLRIIEGSESNTNRISAFIKERLTYDYIPDDNGQLTVVQKVNRSTFNEPRFLYEITDRLEDVKDIKNRFDTLRETVKDLVIELDFELKRLE